MALLAMAMLLGVVACGSDDGGGGQGAPGRLDVLRIGAPGQVTDNLNPLLTNGIADYTAVFHLYDTLVRLTPAGIELALAESIEPNDDATAWTVRVRQGATFHNGDPVTGDDVLVSFALMADPEQSPNYAGFFTDIDIERSRVEDDRTAVIALHRPRGDFVDTMLTFASFVFHAGHTDWRNPIGSGPYRLESYVPGGTTVLVAYQDHWEGAPTVERLEITSLNDPSARLNGVQAGQLDIGLRVDPVGAAALGAGGDGRVQIIRGGTTFANAMTIVLNTKVPPFDDPAVRHAVAQAIDRDALVETVLLGYGSVGNDLVGAGLPGYAEDIEPVARDVDAARATLAGAGVTDIDLVVGDVTPGVVAAGEQIASQLREVGVTVHLDRRDPANYYADFTEFLSRPAQGLYWVNRPASAFLGNFTGSGAFFNPSGFSTPDYDRILAAAQAELDPGARAELFAEAQHLFHEQSGNIVWGLQEQLDATAPGITGIEVVQSIPLFSRTVRS